MLKVGDYFGENALLRDESGTSKGGRWNISCLTVETENGKNDPRKCIKWFQEYDLIYEHGTCKYYYMSNSVSDTRLLQMQDIFRTNVYHVCTRNCFIMFLYIYIRIYIYIYIYIRVYIYICCVRIYCDPVFSGLPPPQKSITPFHISSKMTWIKYTTAFTLLIVVVFRCLGKSFSTINYLPFLKFAYGLYELKQ